jgi:hypothetical protein
MMQWVFGTAISLYLVVGCVVLFHRLRRRGGLSLSGSGPSGDLWPFLAVAALWPLYLRDNAETRRVEAEDACLHCKRPLPTGSTKCLACGWT